MIAARKGIDITGLEICENTTESGWMKIITKKLASIRRNVPWMTRSLRRMCRKKQRLYNKAHEKHSWQEFRSFQRRTTADLRAARWDYINNILVESLEGHQTILEIYKVLASKSCGVAPPPPPPPPPPLKADGQLHPDASKKTEILNQKFTSVFTSDDEDDFSGTVLEGPSIPTIGNIVEWPKCFRTSMWRRRVALMNSLVFCSRNSPMNWPRYTPKSSSARRHWRTTICMEDCKRGPHLQKRTRLWGRKLPPCKPHLHPM